MSLNNDLIKLGLSDKEASTYIVLSKLGPTSPSVLAKIIGANRTSMYDILSRLEEKGLVITYRKNKTTFYLVDDLEKLVEREKNQVQNARAIVDALAKEHATAGLDIKYYLGIEGVKELYATILEEDSKELLVWINSEEFQKLLDQKYVEEWIEKRVKNNIFTKMIQTTSVHAKQYQELDYLYNREIRFIQDGAFDFTSACYIFGDNIVLFDTQGKIVGIRIVNKEIAYMFTQIFRVMWSIAK